MTPLIQHVGYSALFIRYPLLNYGNSLSCQCKRTVKRCTVRQIYRQTFSVYMYSSKIYLTNYCYRYVSGDLMFLYPLTGTMSIGHLKQNKMKQLTSVLMRWPIWTHIASIGTRMCRKVFSFHHLIKIMPFHNYWCITCRLIWSSIINYRGTFA